MSERTEAQRLSEYWEGRANELQPWIDEDDYVEFGYRPEGLKREQDSQRKTAIELRRLEAERDKLAADNKALVDALRTVMGDANHGQHMAWEQRCRQARAALEQHGSKT